MPLAHLLRLESLNYSEQLIADRRRLGRIVALGDRAVFQEADGDRP